MNLLIDYSFFSHLRLRRLFKGMMVSYLTALGGIKENVISVSLKRFIL